MKSRLLTFDDLYNFYSKYTKSKYFNCEEQGCEPIVVQTPATIKFEKSEIYEGLTAVRLQACHTERNLNSSSISKEVMENKLLPTFKNRPILGYIHEVDGEPQFYGHNMHIDPDNENSIVYDEIPVGIIPESNEAELKYNSETEKYEVFVSGYIFDEYTKATDIIEREQELAVSVEISIKQMSYSPKESCLNIEDGYFSGVTILGVNEKGQKVSPGMAGSNIRLKDFSQSNNSMFANQTEETNQKLIETLEKLNSTLSNISKFNINEAENSADENSKEGGNKKVTKFEELLQKYNKTESDIEFEVEGLSDEELEVKFAEVFGEESNEDPTSEEGETTEETVEEYVEETTEETVEEVTETEEFTEEVTETETEETVEEGTPEVGEETITTVEVNETEKVIETEEVETAEEVEATEVKFELIEKSFEVDGRKFSISFELSHSDIAYGLYNLLESYCELDNDWYDIRAVYDDNFVFQGWFTGKIYGQKYTKDGDTVALDGERYELFEELLTTTEKAELEAMRANYSAIQTELSTYKAAEEKADKMTVFEDENYAQFLETPEFKELMEAVDQYSKEELEDKANIAFSKLVKKNKTFALETPTEEKPKASVFAFGRIETKSSFLDGLLGKDKK